MLTENRESQSDKDLELHNTWEALSDNGTNDWKGSCPCSKCNADAIEPDIRED